MHWIYGREVISKGKKERGGFWDLEWSAKQKTSLI